MTPGNVPYSTQDVIILVYFRSRGVQYRTIRDFILAKGSKISRKEENLVAKMRNLTRQQREEGDVAMFDDRTYEWNLKVTDQWLLDRTKEWAIADGKTLTEAPLYYDKLKALTHVGKEEEKVIARNVSLE